MAITVTLYQTKAIPIKADKTLGTAVATYSNVKFLEPYDDTDPVIRIRGKINFDDANYLSVTGNGDTKYYYITGVEVKSPAICHISCHKDVLKTHLAWIQQLQCYIKRSTSNGDAYLPDTRPVRVYNNVEKLSFRDENDNVEGFVVPGETKEHQRLNGYYIYSTLQTGYGDPNNPNTPWPPNYVPIQND